MRYYLLPIIIISLMLLVLDNEKSVINKEMVSSTKEIRYPFFDNAKIDNYITNYLDDYDFDDNEKVIFKVVNEENSNTNNGA